MSGRFVVKRRETISKQRQKKLVQLVPFVHIFAVQISGKYILPKSALVEFLVGDFAFEIVHKSTWHMNTILLFVEKE